LFYSNDAAPAVHGSTKSIFRRVELFHEAIVFMMLRGDKTLLADYNFTPKAPSSQPLTRMSITFHAYYFTDVTLSSSSSYISNCHLTQYISSQVEEWSELSKNNLAR
jgi:hypothetical protein